MSLQLGGRCVTWLRQVFTSLLVTSDCITGNIWTTCSLVVSEAAVQAELSAVLNQHAAVLHWNGSTPLLTFSFWKTKAPVGAAANLKTAGLICVISLRVSLTKWRIICILQPHQALTLRCQAFSLIYHKPWGRRNSKSACLEATDKHTNTCTCSTPALGM